MNILVTGCAGFIGSSLVTKLLEMPENFKIIGIDNMDNYYPIEIKKKNISEFISNDMFTFYEGDIRNSKLLEDIFSNNEIDAVVHLAAKAGVRNSFMCPDEYFSVNLDGTKTILETMRKYKVKKLVFSSSSSVYGNRKETVFSEDFTELKPISPYAETKLASEKMIREYCDLYGINAVCLRYFTVFGPKQRPDLAIAKFVRLIKNNETIEIYGSDTTERDYTYIDDTVSGTIAAIKYDRTPFEIINLGSGNPIKIKSLIAMLNKLLGQASKGLIVQVPAQQGDVARTCADITKAKRLLNYQPQSTFQDNLKKYIEYVNT